MLARLVHKFCKRFDIALLYHSGVGVKCCNQLIRSERFSRFVQGGVFQVAGDQLRLGFDALGDEHTLLGVPIAESPHLELIQVIRSGKELASSRYVARAAQGTLDFRPPRKLDATFLRMLEQKCEKTLTAIQAGDFEPIKTVQVGGLAYIADGKHRAAACSWLGVPCRCVDASLLIQDSFYWWVYRKMKSRPARYRKHLQWFESLKAID